MRAQSFGLRVNVFDAQNPRIKDFALRLVGLGLGALSVPVWPDARADSVSDRRMYGIGSV